MEKQECVNGQVDIKLKKDQLWSHNYRCFLNKISQNDLLIKRSSFTSKLFLAKDSYFLMEFI